MTPPKFKIGDLVKVNTKNRAYDQFNSRHRHIGVITSVKPSQYFEYIYYVQDLTDFAFKKDWGPCTESFLMLHEPDNSVTEETITDRMIKIYLN